ncbi:hypothetical protein FKM82_013535 [Ascaphus truei]
MYIYIPSLFSHCRTKLRTHLVLGTDVLGVSIFASISSTWLLPAERSMLQLHSHIHRVAVASVTSSSARARAPARLACPCTHLPACTRALPSGYVPCTLLRSILDTPAVL